MLHPIVTDIITLGNEVQPGPSLWYRLLKRMLGLITAGVAVNSSRIDGTPGIPGMDHRPATGPQSSRAEMFLSQ